MSRLQDRFRSTLALLALTAVLTSALWLFAAPPAVACSCEEMRSSSVEYADAAAVGTIVATMPIPSQYQDQKRFVAEVEVSNDLKDNLADVIYVTSERDDGGNCGVTWRIGTEIAAAIYEEDGVLRSDSCSEMSLELANSWSPAVTVGGSATLLIGGGQPNRVVAYDQNAMPIAYAFEEGNVRSLSVCPGAAVMLELVNHRDTPTTIETRSLATFEVMSSVPAIFEGDSLLLSHVRCDSADGTAATTNGYVLAGGSLSISNEPFDAGRFDPQGFWPELESTNTAPVEGESWMETAAELEAPVTIENTGQFAPVEQFGSGESFGIEDQVDEALAETAPVDGAVQDDAGNNPSVATVEPESNTWIWFVVAIGLVLGLGVAVLIRR